MWPFRNFQTLLTVNFQKCNVAAKRLDAPSPTDGSANLQPSCLRVKLLCWPMQPCDLIALDLDHQATVPIAGSPLTQRKMVPDWSTLVLK